MSTPFTWANLPMSQDDNRTIAEYIAEQIASHNVDVDAHMEVGASLASHREAEILDHPDLSVQAVHIVDDVPEVAPKAGVLPAIGTSWTAAGTGLSFTPLIGAYCSAGSGTYIAVGNDGSVGVSADGDTWVSGSALPSGTYTVAAANANVAVVGGSVSGGVALQYTTDGTSWTACTGLLGAVAYSLIYDGTMFVASCTMASGHGRTYDVFTSTDGIAWTAQGASLDVAITGLGYDGVAEYRGFEYFSSTFYMSTDLSTWTDLDVNPRDFLFCMAWTGLQWVASGENVEDSSGTDVITPVSYVAPQGGLPNRSTGIAGEIWNVVAVVPQVAFMLQPANSYGMAIANPDTALWTPVTLPDGYGANGVFASPTRVIAFGNGPVTGAIYYADYPS